jgi:hypothetical protein
MTPIWIARGGCSRAEQPIAAADLRVVGNSGKTWPRIGSRRCWAQCTCVRTSNVKRLAGLAERGHSHSGWSRALLPGSRARTCHAHLADVRMTSWQAGIPSSWTRPSAGERIASDSGSWPSNAEWSCACSTAMYHGMSGSKNCPAPAGAGGCVRSGSGSARMAGVTSRAVTADEGLTLIDADTTRAAVIAVRGEMCVKRPTGP